MVNFQDYGQALAEVLFLELPRGFVFLLKARSPWDGLEKRKGVTFKNEGKAKHL